MNTKRRGQTTVEMALLMGFVVVGFIALAPYVQRHAAGYIKGNAEAYGTPMQLNKKWSTHGRSVSLDTSQSSLSSQLSRGCQNLGGAAAMSDTECVRALIPIPTDEAGAAPGSEYTKTFPWLSITDTSGNAKTDAKLFE